MFLPYVYFPNIVVSIPFPCYKNLRSRLSQKLDARRSQVETLTEYSRVSHGESSIPAGAGQTSLNIADYSIDRLQFADAHRAEGLRSERYLFSGNSTPKWYMKIECWRMWQLEIRQIIKKRTLFETLLVRRIPKKSDFLRYAAYEMDLEALRKKRVKRLSA